MARRNPPPMPVLWSPVERVPQAPWGDVAEDANLARLANLISHATGWPVSPNTTAPTKNSSPASNRSRSFPANPGTGKAPGRDFLDAERTAKEQPPAWVARLREAFAAVSSDLEQARSALWEREAELAAGVPVARRPDETAHLAARLTAVLRGGSRALGCQSAGLYLLDEATTELKLRSSWNLPVDRSTAPARPLRGAIADLEALAGHAVVVRDPALVSMWNAPENFPAALCVPVSSPTTPLGTLWFFAERPRDFTEAQTELAEIIAGRLATELDRAALLEESSRQVNAVRELAEVLDRDHERRRRTMPKLPGWEISATTGDPDEAKRFFDWRLVGDERLLLMAGQTRGLRAVNIVARESVRAALFAAIRGNSSPSRLLTDTNSALVSAGLFADVVVAACVIHPRTGVYQVAVAGDASLTCTRQRGRQQRIPLPQTIMLGGSVDCRPSHRRGRLNVGDGLELFLGDSPHAAWAILRAGKQSA